MNKYSKIVMSSLVAISFSACGGGGDSDSGTSSSTGSSVSLQEYDVTIVDDPIIGGHVSAPECNSYQDNGHGSYTLKDCISVPTTIEALGGVIDFNNNGEVDANETAQSAPLMLRISQSNLQNDFVVSPLTTLAYAQDTDLSALAASLGISQEDLFTQNNTSLQQAVNALLISAREAGIVQYDSFVADLRSQIIASQRNGIDAITDAKNYMDTNKDAYIQDYGIVFGGFVSDTTNLDLTDSTQAIVYIGQQNSVTSGKIRLSGFVYDKVIADANITLYDGENAITSVISDADGRYSLEVDETILNSSKVLKLEAILSKLKLVSYITTDEIKRGLISSKLLSANEVALMISNVTTAKAVLIEKTNPEALQDPTALNEAKALIETEYPTELLDLSAAIKDVVDNNKTIDQNNTLLFAQSIVVEDVNTTLISVETPTNINIDTTTVTTDPMLSAQLSNTKTTAIAPDSYQAILEGRELYRLDYYSSGEPGSSLAYDTMLLSNNTHSESIYRENNGTWELEHTRIMSDDTQIGWSSDGSTLYVTGPLLPFKENLMSVEEITINNQLIHIYYTRSEIVGEPSEVYFNTFVENSDHSGTINFTSIEDSNKSITINYDDEYSDYNVTYYLYDDGTYAPWYNVNNKYHYRVMEKYGKTYIVFDDGETNDGGGSIFYLDFANQKLYQQDYHNIGFIEYDIKYDNAEVVNVWKNLSPDDYSKLESMINSNVYNQSFTADYTYNMAMQITINNFIKSFGN